MKLRDHVVCAARNAFRVYVQQYVKDCRVRGKCCAAVQHFSERQVIEPRKRELILETLKFTSKFFAPELFDWRAANHDCDIFRFRYRPQYRFDQPGGINTNRNSGAVGGDAVVQESLIECGKQ